MESLAGVEREYLEEEETETIDSNGNSNEESNGQGNEQSNRQGNEELQEVVIFKDINIDLTGREGKLEVLDYNWEEAESNFKLVYVNIENIAIVKRIRNNKKVDELVKSIKNTGLLMPIVVAPTATEGLYVLISGYRRLIACAKVGMRKVPCIVNTVIKTPEIPILEALYNHTKQYTIKECIDYIEYLEKEKGITSPNFIEYLLGFESGDYTKLKDILNDEDIDIIQPLMDGEMSISQAFKKLESRRKKESKEEKLVKSVDKAFQSGENISVSGEMAEENDVLSMEEISSLAFMANDVDKDDRSLEEMIEEGKTIPGFEAKVQKTWDREIVDPALRRAVMERDKNTCRCCDEGGPEYIDVNDFHHIIPVFLGGPDTVENAMCVCVKCHKLIHLYARNQLHILNIDKMNEKELVKFKRIVKFGEIIRKAIQLNNMKLDDYKKLDGIKSIGRQMPGKKNIVT